MGEVAIVRPRMFREGNERVMAVSQWQVHVEKMRSESTPPARILIVDDDPGIREVITDFLMRHGFDADAVGDGPAMARALAARRPDLIVLDVMLPGEDGLSLCRKLAAAHGPPVIILSAMGDETDRIVGLELGADDYLPKPCNPRELLARIKAVLRRREDGASPNKVAAVLEFAGWRLDLLARELTAADGNVVPLSSGEFALLRALVERPQRILTRDQLLELARGPESDAYDRAIDVQISRLRRKLGDGDAGADLIRTVRNEGYIFNTVVNQR